eukprot:SM000029S10556  [mRNA]  locus=s29:800375:801144:+ [translate_table: standard]
MPYTGKSTLALVARVSAVVVGVAYGATKLAYLKASSAAHRVAGEASALAHKVSDTTAGAAHSTSESVKGAAKTTADAAKAASEKVTSKH